MSSEPDPTAIDPRKASRVVFFVFVTVFLDLVGFGVVAPLMPFYVESMGGSAQTVGLLFGCFSAAQLLATPFLGKLSDRVGRRPVILVSLAGNAAAMVIFAFATKVALLPLLFLSRILAGATAGNLSACQAAIADTTNEADRAKGMGKLGAGIGLGLMLGPVIGGQLSHLGPWAPPLGAAALALADFTGAVLFMPETRVKSAPRPVSAAPATPQPSLTQVLAQRPLVMVLSLYFLTFLAMTNLQVALAYLVKGRLAWGEREVSNIFGLVGLLGLIIQGGLIGRLSRRFGQLPLILTGSALLAAGMGAIGASHEALPLLAGVALIGSGLGLVNPLLSALASELAGAERRGAVLGFAQSSGGLARTIGPVWSGFLAAHVAPAAPFFSGALAASISVIIGVMLRAEQRALRVDVATR
jgi:DHA1 family tetracycline resistance protein-like MFS transporter